MRLWIGTSGFSYKEWKGSFYPADLPAAKMFGHYSQRFRTVEINNTFYRYPTEKLVAGWLRESPAGFRYSLKAPGMMTHMKRLKNCADSMALFLGQTTKLGDRCGALLFNLGPTMKKDVPLLRDFMALVPREVRAAYEFRNPEWLADDVFAALSDAGAALCIADSADACPPLVATTSWGYVRLRDEGYKRADLANWHSRIAGQKWDEAFVYFKHEDAGKGAEFALRMKKIAGANDAA